MVALVATMMTTMSAQAKTQDWGGRVIDEKGEPMPYVNVVLLSLPDSAFVQGAMTDMDGVFKIVTDVNQGLFKVTREGECAEGVVATVAGELYAERESQLRRLL